MIQPGRPVPSSPKNNGGGMIRREMMVTSISSQYPLASELQGIEAVLPGGADRVMKLVEAQAPHRQRLENRVVWSNIVGERIGQVFAAGIAFFSLWIARDLIVRGQTPEGLAIMFTAIAGLVSVFIYGRKGRDKELQRKRE